MLVDIALQKVIEAAVASDFKLGPYTKSGTL
jgi:hypothetical protein